MQGEFAPISDILLLSETDRGCERTDFRNVTHDFAEALGYYYVLATEFIELFGAHGRLDPDDRQASSAVPLTIDFVFSRRIEAVDAGLCRLEQCDGVVPTRDSVAYVQNRDVSLGNPADITAPASWASVSRRRR
ncbi:MAG: hypothetical protein P8R42_06115 [Candidatus Binatia bacterium]|nr:hypothetical protein [Candidatus Binatia bacterium]